MGKSKRFECSLKISPNCEREIYTTSDNILRYQGEPCCKPCFDKQKFSSSLPQTSPQEKLEGEETAGILKEISNVLNENKNAEKYEYILDVVKKLIKEHTKDMQCYLIDRCKSFKTTQELRSELVNIFSNSFVHTNSWKLAKDIIWNNTFYERIFLSLSSTVQKDKNITKISGEIYAISSELNIRTNKSTEDSDWKCAERIVSNEKLVTSMLLMDKLIQNYFILHSKIAYAIFTETNFDMPLKNWNIASQLIRNIDEDIIELETNLVEKIKSSRSFIEASKYYHEDKPIFLKD